MNQSELEAIVAKVEAGESLTERELEGLEHAVAMRPGNLDWMLCLAHALINADRPSAALPLLESAASLKPGEVLVALARARAFGALERWAEAEQGLREVLSRLPGHADALRALALVRLRAGAPAEAAALARRVLDIDPLDDAARLLLAEAEAASGDEGLVGEPSSGETCGTLDEFGAELARALRERGLESRISPKASAAVVQLGPGRTVRLSLRALHAACKTEPRGSAWFIEDVVGRLSRLGALERVPPLAEVRERIRPVLRPPAFLSRTGPVAHVAASAGLWWLFALDHPDFVSYLPPEALTTWGLSAAQLTGLALENLERTLVGPARYRLGAGGFEQIGARTDRFDLLTFEAGDGYDASRLLSPRHQALLAEISPEPWAVALPSTRHALLARLNDEKAITIISALAADEVAAEDGLCKGLFVLEAGALRPLDPGRE